MTLGYDFDLWVSVPADGIARVAVRGELDMAVADVLLAAVSGALGMDGVWLVEVELSGVRFLDAYGVSTLLTARSDAQVADKTFRVRGVSGLPLRVLEITGVLGLLSDKQSEDAG